MRSCTRYLFRQLIGPVLVVAVVLTLIIWLTQSLRFVDLIINKGLTIEAFLYLTVLLVPSLLSLALPVAVFCGILLVYHRLNQESELVVMRAAGLSQRRLALPALAVAGLATAASYAIALYLLPVTQTEFKRFLHEIRSNVASLILQEGVFNTPLRGLTVFVRARGDEGELLGILVHDSRVQGKPVTMMAERGALVRTEHGPRFVLVNGNRQEVDPARRQLSLLYFERYSLDLGAVTGAARTLREEKERFVGELLDPADVPEKYRDQYRAEGHKRLTWPLAPLAFAGMALAALLTGEFNRRGQWRRVLAAVVATLGFQVAQLGIASLVVKTPMLTPAMYLLPLATIAACLVIFRDQRIRRGAAPVAPPGTVWRSGERS